MTDLNIFQRMNEVRKEVDYIKKDQAVEGYKAVTHDQVTAELRPYFIKFGIVTVLKQISGQTFDTGKATRAGVPYTRYEGMYELDFVNMDDPKDKVTACAGGFGEDYGDKGPGKAASYAVKTILLKSFNIETGESDESRQEQKPTPISDEQLITLREICESKGYEPEEKLKSLAERVYQLKDIADLPEIRFEDAKQRMDKLPMNEA